MPTSIKNVVQYIYLLGSGGASDGGGLGIVNGKVIHIPGNNPETRQMIAAARAALAVDAAGAGANLGALSAAAHAALLEAASKVLSANANGG